MSAVSAPVAGYCAAMQICCLRVVHSIEKTEKSVSPGCDPVNQCRRLDSRPTQASRDSTID